MAASHSGWRRRRATFVSRCGHRTHASSQLFAFALPAYGKISRVFERRAARTRQQTRFDRKRRRFRMRVAPLLVVLVSALALTACPKRNQTVPEGSGTTGDTGASTMGAGTQGADTG